MGRTWTDDEVLAECRQIASAIGRFPTNAELQQMSRGDLSNQIARRFGFRRAAAMIGAEHKHSDSDLGWEGEAEFVALCGWNGLEAKRVGGVKNPFDVLIEGVLRVDVKTARKARYGTSTGWYFRVGKVCQADIVVLLRFDKRDIVVFRWWETGTTNISLSESLGKHAARHNNWSLIRSMVASRQAERLIPVEATT